jgi:hypothetical protein
MPLFSPAQLAANQLQMNVINLQNQIVTLAGAACAQYQGILTSGIPAQGNKAAILASDIQTALGTANLATLQAILAAIASVAPAP